MLRWLIERKIRAFERDYDYDMTYAREILDAAGPRALMRFGRVQALGTYRADVPRDAWFCAKVAAIAAEDCGPCTQLNVTMAERAGVPPEHLRAVIAGDDDALPDDARLTVDFIRAAHARSPDVDALRDEVAARFGRSGVVALTYALTAARIYPTIKYALGYGHACTLVRVGDGQVRRAGAATEAAA